MAHHSADVSRPGEPAASWTFLIKPQEGGRSETPSPRLRMWEQGPEGHRAPAPRPAWPGPEARSLSCRVLDPAVSPRGERGTRNARGFEKRTALWACAGLRLQWRSSGNTRREVTGTILQAELASSVVSRAESCPLKLTCCGPNSRASIRDCVWREGL